MSKHLSSKIKIIVDGRLVGEVQSISVEENTGMKMVWPVGEPDPNEVEEKPEYVVTASRMRFDRKRIAEAFNRGFVSINAQRSPLQLVIEDNFAGYRIDTIIMNCWMGHVGTTYTIDDYVIAEDIRLCVGDIYSEPIIGLDMGIGKSKSTTATISSDGVTCKKCNDFNKYCQTPSESDGSHICYKCRNGH